MSPRSSSRVYNPLALEAWFGNVALNWEAQFSREILQKGREIYRNGHITGIELAEDDAIVHCSFARKDTCYAVIEWGPKGPNVRCSMDDAELGCAVAAGGLYEIEELIADEIEPLAYEPSESADAASSSEGSILPPEEPEDNRPARRLTPRFEGLAQGLRLSAYWTNADLTREIAFHEGGIELVGPEREALVRLTGWAKDADFQYRKSSKDFLLKEAERIAPFFSHARKRWESAFGFIDLDLEAQEMAKGVQEIKIVGRVDADGDSDMRVDWRVRLGRRWLDPEDAERLVRAGRGVHVIKGFGLVKIHDDQTAALADWRVAAAGQSEAAQSWPRYMVFSLFGERGAELDLESELDSWRKALTAEVETKVENESNELPDFLRPYQKLGVEWMAHLRRQHCHGLLADEMGLGKTLQILTLLKEFPFEDRHSLIVCPASVVPVWQNEAARWYPSLKTAVLRSANVWDSVDQDSPILWIASYTQLRRHKHLLDGIDFGYAVLDEAQQIKNPDAKVTQACCVIQAECRLALTGTPLENRLLDVWTIFRFLMPGLLGSRRRFEDAVTCSNAEAKVNFERHLRKQIAPFMLRRKKDSVGKDLPPKVEVDLVCPISETQKRVYEELLSKGRSEMGDDLEDAMQSQTMSFFALLTRLRQACCDPGLIPGVGSKIEQSGKIQLLLTRLEEALGGSGSRKVVVFSQFVQLLKRLRPVLEEQFPEVSLFELTGETKDRAKPVDQFQSKKGPAIILVSLRAGGTGITLNAADYVFLLDPWWNPAVESQAVDRVHRIGQRRRVFVYRMITQGTIEERIQNLKKEKRDLFESTLGDLGGMNNLREHFSDLQKLVKLLPPS